MMKKEKVNILLQLFQNEIQQHIFMQDQIIISLPVMDYNYSSMVEQCKKLVYDIYDIQSCIITSRRSEWNSICRKRRLRRPSRLRSCSLAWFSNQLRFRVCVP